MFFFIISGRRYIYIFFKKSGLKKEQNKSISGAGAVFQITSNDGKADRMLMASQLLTERIQDITA